MNTIAPGMAKTEGVDQPADHKLRLRILALDQGHDAGTFGGGEGVGHDPV